jgi:predicted hydrolase (HD superfamily)
VENVKETWADATTADGQSAGDGDLVGIIVRHALMEEAIISRMATALAANDKDTVFSLAAALVGQSK